MGADVLPIPGIVLGAYPERVLQAEGTRSSLADLIRSAWSSVFPEPRYRSFAARVAMEDARLGPLPIKTVLEHVNALRAALARYKIADEHAAQTFALIQRVCRHVLGVELFPTQLIAARVMLDKKLAEMATGEGKTLAAAVCAATAALAGIPIHVITANDYLVRRDAEYLGPFYEALGLTTGIITADADRLARRAAYQSDIVYCTASELVFDYLRDTMIRGRSRDSLSRRAATIADPSGEGVLLRGLCMAVVDEADSVLIDEARVPLVLSERNSNEEERRHLLEALELSGRLTNGIDFIAHSENMAVELTEQGRHSLEQHAFVLRGLWRNRLHREETVCTAIAATRLFQKGRHYLVRDRRVAIIDERTGRIASGRVWSQGLQQLIELKEGCRPSGRTVPIAQITYQRFFRRYLALAGMSGTLCEARNELLATYGLSVVRVPLHHPNRRRRLPTRFYPTRDAQWKAVLDRVRRVTATGRPVLVGTDSVIDSEELGRRLAEAGVDHAVLNARQDREEARIIATAGARGHVTVATNMAGRGTDIALASGVAQLGGLHVICCQYNASRRLDRQLTGRCARRGDPGSTEALLSLEHPSVAKYVPQWMRRRVPETGFERPQWLVRLLVNAPQWLEERRGRAQRQELMRRDAQTQRSLSFGRPIE